MKLYIEYENQVEAKSNIVKVFPKTKNKKVVSVDIKVLGQPTIIQRKPYIYEEEISEMLKVISNQNERFDSLMKDYKDLESKYQKLTSKQQLKE